MTQDDKGRSVGTASEAVLGMITFPAYAASNIPSTNAFCASDCFDVETGRDSQRWQGRSTRQALWGFLPTSCPGSMSTFS